MEWPSPRVTTLWRPVNIAVSRPVASVVAWLLMSQPTRAEVVTERQLPRPKVWHSQRTGLACVRLTAVLAKGRNRTVVSVSAKLLLTYTHSLTPCQCITATQLGRPWTRRTLRP